MRRHWLLLALVAASCRDDKDPIYEQGLKNQRARDKEAGENRADSSYGHSKAVIDEELPIALPAHPTSKEVIGRGRSSVRSQLGAGLEKGNETDDASVGAVRLRVWYANGIAVKFGVIPGHFIGFQDRDLIVRWLGASSLHTPFKLNGRNVMVVEDPDYVAITDAATEKMRSATDGGCAGGRSKRAHWISAGGGESGGSSPSDEGFRQRGNCGEVLYVRGFKCDESTVRSVHGESPWLTEASALGFNELVCEEVENGEPSGRLSRYSLSSLRH